MLEYVERLLASEDNIIDQLKALKVNKKHKEVKKYIKLIKEENDSPYVKYCIDKYYFDKEVDEVKPPIRPLYVIFGTKGRKKIAKIIDSTDNLIEQIILLKKHKGTKSIDNYIEKYLTRANEYTTYCIQKYYYDLEVKVVKPTAKSLNIKLYPIRDRALERKQEKIQEKQKIKSIKKIKEGDKIQILDGPFKDFVGIVKSVNKKELIIIVTLELFGELCDVEHLGEFKLYKEDKNEK